MNENKLARRSFLRFGIRDLLWAMLVVGLAIGWWVERNRPGGMKPGWREMREEGLMARDPETVAIRFVDGDDIVWTHFRGVRNNWDQFPDLP